MIAATDVRATLDAGDLLRAYDLVEAALAADALIERPALLYLRVLVLARMGDIDRALALHGALAADGGEDVAALKGRLLKDKALRESGPARISSLKTAQAQYAETFRRTGGYFSGINAATLAALSGDLAEAKSLAMALLGDPEVMSPRSYWAAATRGEALILAGQGVDAEVAFASAVDMGDATLAARAATLRQLALLASEAGTDLALHARIAATLRPPALTIWSGHIFNSGAVAEDPLREGIVTALERSGSMIGYGALAAGFDILTAEAMLARGASVHIVLPFSEQDFVEQSLRPFGDGWIKRYEAVRARAASVVLASTGRAIDDPGQFAYSTKVALGLASIHADALSTRVEAFAGWDGVTSNGAAGTAADVALFNHAGIDTRIIWHGEREPPPAAPHPPSAVNRREASILFTDYAGFSTLDEAQLPRFWSAIMGRIGAKLTEHSSELLYANSWGDALYAVIETPLAAARLALEIAEALGAVDPASLGIAAGGMRMALHHGRVYEVIDPLTGRRTFIGGAVNLTARIEPVTPVGAVYTTAAFAAMLRLTGASEFGLSYMGTLPLAKSYGAFPLYELTRVAADGKRMEAAGGTLNSS